MREPYHIYVDRRQGKGLFPTPCVLCLGAERGWDYAFNDAQGQQHHVCCVCARSEPDRLRVRVRIAATELERAARSLREIVDQLVPFEPEPAEAQRH
ncbi:MAG: hypothetical protein ACREN4_08730 [Candidatus Dormibacteria bacterium]